VEGSDRYALRYDGLIYKNGAKLYNLVYVTNPLIVWISMTVDQGTVYAIRQDGPIAVNGEITVTLPIKGAQDLNYAFTKIIRRGGTTYSLRWDGAVYQNGIQTPIFKFTAGKGTMGGDDGLAPDSRWIGLDIDPVTGDLFALRSDGHVYKGDLPSGDSKGVLVAELPFPATQPVSAGDLYYDFQFSTGGTWYTIRGTGAVFTDLNQVSPVVDYDGTAADSSETFYDLLTDGLDFWGMRGDGRVYRGTDTDEIIDLPKDFYSAIALSDLPPNLSNFKNQPPVMAVYQVSTVEGLEVSLPVIVTDSDLRSEEIGVDPVEPIPAGSNWDSTERLLDWVAPAPVGNYQFRVTADDGVNKPKTFTHKIKVVASDTDPVKNKKPLVSKIKKPQALVGYEMVLPIIAVDPDGDPVTITVDSGVYPFTAGATFDPATSLFTWTPAFDDIGKVSVQFLVSDGTQTVKLKVQMTVVSPLIF
jgi:hypothetical protein